MAAPLAQLALVAAFNAPSCEGAHPVFALAPVVSARALRRSGKQYQAFATLRFRIVRRTTATLPAKERALLGHARGHRSIAERVARASAGRVEAIGSTQAQTAARLKQGIARLAHDAQSELDREERVYDSVTEDGAAQNQGPVYGFPGGKDVQSACAAPRS